MAPAVAGPRARRVLTRRLTLGMACALLSTMLATVGGAQPALADAPTFPLSVPVAAAADTDGTIGVFALGTDGQVWSSQEMMPGGSSWLPWTSIGAGTMISPPAVVGGDDGFWVFAIGADHQVYRNWRRNRDSAWTGWGSIGGGWLGGSISAANAGQGNITVFGIGSDSAAYYNRQAAWDTDSWSGWYGLGGAFVSSVSVIRDGIGRLQVFGVGTDHRVYRDREVSASGAWTGWGSIGDGWLDGTPALALTGPSNMRIDVFAVGSDQQVYRDQQLAWNSDDFTGWGGLGGIVATKPLAAGLDADYRTEVYHLGMDARIYRDQQTSPGGDWTGWASIGDGALTTPPAVARNGEGMLEVLALGTDNHIYRSRQTSPSAGTWTGWGSTACSYRWSPGTTFSPGESYTGCRGDRFSYLPDGRVVYVNPQGAVGWAAGATAPGGHLQFGTDGNLVLLDGAGQAVWSTNTAGRGAAMYFAPDGDLMILDAGNDTAWETGTGDIPTDATLNEAVTRTTNNTQTMTDLNVIASFPRVAMWIANPESWNFLGNGPFWDTWPFTPGGICGFWLASYPRPNCDTRDLMDLEPGSDSYPPVHSGASMEVAGRNLLGVIVMKWVHEVQFTYDGSTVRIDSTIDYYTKFPNLWVDGGLTTNYSSPGMSVTPVYSFKQRKMQFCIFFKGIGCIAERFPWSKISIDANGTVSTVGGIA